MNRKVVLCTLVALAVGAATAPATSASHSWGGYHWARTANPFVVQMDNNLTTPSWHAIGAASSADWSRSTVMDTPLSAPKSDNKRCKASSGRVEVCNGKYGFNGWLGLAQVWTSGGHIVQGTAKMNDSYLAGASYTPTNRQHVLCQEVGHTFGLAHQSESGADLNTCMDYSDLLDNPSPNAHDYEQLEAIYSHLDTSSTLALAASSSGPKGRLKRVRNNLYVEDLGKGDKRFTWVYWKDDRVPHGPPAVD